MSLLYEIFILPIEIIYRAIYLGSLQFTHNYGLSILVLSCISAVILCRSWQEDAATALRKERFSKSFLWGLRGWTRLRTLAIRLPASEGCPAARICNTSAEKTLLPLIGNALSSLFTLQETDS